MKNFYIFLVVMLFLGGCAHKAEYNEDVMIAPVDEGIVVDKPLQNLVIYIDSAVMSSRNYKPSSRLGGDDSLDINLGEFVSGSTMRFFKNYFTNVTISSDKNVLNSNALIVIPDIGDFSYGFSSKDGLDITARAFVGYNLRLKIFKNQKQIFNKNICVNDKNYGDSEFYGSGDYHHAQVAGVFQRALANDYNVNARAIIDSINLAN